MLVKNTTAQNRSKQQRLSSEHIIPAQNVRKSETIDFLKSLHRYSDRKEEVLYSIGCFLLRNNKNAVVKNFLNEYDFTPIAIDNIPEDEFDLLGSVYQFLNTKIENLEKGSFYTGSDVARDFVSDLDFSNGQIIFDPACGSGAFLYNSNAGPEQIFGVDFDSIAIMIAKFNYFIKFPDADYPKLFCEDFFSWKAKSGALSFDYIIGNPPYGANLDLSRINSQNITSGESFSYFIEFCYELLKKDGFLRFLLPEAVLNVKRHTDVRDFILNNTNLVRIKKYSQKFSSVMSDVYMVELNSKIPKDVLFVDKVTTSIPLAVYKGLKNHIFVHLTEQDISIIEKINKLQAFDLSTSTFGLGVVTGDNKTKLHDKAVPGSEHIYTGKEVEKYRLLAPKKYLVFNRSNLQQVAPEEIYRAQEKIVYKTINKYLKVALDTTGSLTSNSANIIIPNIPELDIYTVLALLNSNLYSYLHLKLFGGVNKIAKENLMALPFPSISLEDKITMRKLIDDAVMNGNDFALQSFINRNIFDLQDSEIEYMESCVRKKSKRCPLDTALDSDRNSL